VGTQMHYIILDLEFNQDFSNTPVGEIRGTKYPFEIIQVGAIKLDFNFNIVGSFNRFVKPGIYEKVNLFITELTGITTDQLMNEKSFPEIYNELIEFTEDTNSILCIWGMSDIRELYKSAEYYSMNIESLPKMFINIQPYASLHFQLPKKVQLRLQNVVEMLSIPIIDKFHDALNDSIYTAQVFKKIYNNSIQPKIYDPSYIKPRPKQHKKIIDVDALIYQFEKMYSREMTEEEKSIIILAYKMGKTNQFLKSVE
jgi:DNA polymerase III alpha subunit (gram-positive type)